MTEKLTKQQNDIFRIIEKVYPDKEIETFRNLAKKGELMTKLDKYITRKLTK